MRGELKLIELIEQYLLGKMSDSERASFEERVENDVELKQQVVDQKNLMEALERISIRQSANRAKRKLKTGKWGLNFGLGGLIVVAIASILFLVLKNEASDLPEERTFLTTAEEQLKGQVFKIDNTKDQTLETEGGIVLVIPKNAFEGDPESISIEVKEALTAESIIKAGLSTTSDGELLETAGMFKISAFSNGDEVKMKEGISILTHVPSETKDPDMQLFHGQVQLDKSINWVNPIPIEKFLTTVNILSLDFYPPAYLPALKKNGYDYKNKVWTDSLYYSFASGFHVSDRKLERKEVRISRPIEFRHLGDSIRYEYGWKDVEPRREYLSSDEWTEDLAPLVVEEEGSLEAVLATDSTSTCFRGGLNPASIQSIWDPNFNNTLLATYEFEERLEFMHSLNDDNCQLLNAYINNLNKPMWFCDSLAYLATGNEIFQLFMNRKDGRVLIDDAKMQALQNYFEEKRMKYVQQAAENEHQFIAKNKKLDEEFKAKQKAFTKEEIVREKDNLETEFKLNMGKIKYNKHIANGYRVHVETGVFYNIDKYVRDATSERKSLDYKDPITGDKVNIKYEPITVTLTSKKDTGRIFVYLIPKELNSFMRVKKEVSGEYSEKLNSSIQYDLLVIKYENEEIFASFKKNVRSKNYKIKGLKLRSREELNKLLSKSSNAHQKTDELKSEVDWRLSEIKESIRQRKNKERSELKSLVRAAIFPCSNTPAKSEFLVPVDNNCIRRVASGFGRRMHPIYKVYKMHTGLDFTASTGCPIFASRSGRVIKVERAFSGYGKMVKILHDDQFTTMYAHMSEILVKEGDYVDQGFTIGKVGSTGYATAPHLHFEIISYGQKVRPAKYLDLSKLQGLNWVGI